MHPAYSVILFTTASGAGYGLLTLLGCFGALDWLPGDRWYGLAGLLIAFALISAGLISSTSHLGHPERAWRAFSQWRTSWLSREGVLAVWTFIPASLFALGWVVFEDLGGVWAAFGWLSAISAMATVCCTGMIYASLRTIPQWNDALVPMIYIALSLSTGAICLNALLYSLGENSDWAEWLAVLLILMALLLKASYWIRIDTAQKRYTAEQATGLVRIGKVRPLEPPHTQPNFVMREMGFAVARKHARKLRVFTFYLAFVIPLFALLASSLIASATFGLTMSFLSLFSASAGVAIERWLFFAEAEHVAMLYYGAEAV